MKYILAQEDIHIALQNFSFPTHPHQMNCLILSSLCFKLYFLGYFKQYFKYWVRGLEAASGHSFHANFVAFDLISFTTHLVFQHLRPGIRHFAFDSAGILHLRRYDHHYRACCTFDIRPPLVISLPQRGVSMTISNFRVLLCSGDQKI